MDFIILAVMFAGFVFLECFIWWLKRKVDTKQNKLLDVKYLDDSIKYLKVLSYIIIAFNFLLILFSLFTMNWCDLCFSSLYLICFFIYNYSTFKLLKEKYSPVIINKVFYAIALIVIITFELIAFKM